MAQVAAEVMAATIPIHAAIGPRATAHLSSEQRPSPLSLRTKFSRQKRTTPEPSQPLAEPGAWCFESWFGPGGVPVHVGVRSVLVGWREYACSSDVSSVHRQVWPLL